MSRKGKIRSVPDGVDAKNPDEKGRGKSVGKCVRLSSSVSCSIGSIAVWPDTGILLDSFREIDVGAVDYKGSVTNHTFERRESFVCVLPSRCFLTSFFLFSGGGYPSNRRHVGCELLLLESVLIECSNHKQVWERERCRNQQSLVELNYSQ